MKQTRGARLCRALITAFVLAAILAVTVFAGSPRDYFTFSFTDYSGQTCSTTGQKTDANEASGDHANVYITTHYATTAGLLHVRYRAFHSGDQVTASHWTTGIENFVLSYDYVPSFNPVNGYYTLYGTSVNSRGVSGGYWCP